jgi:hypothetical protein
MTLTPETQRLNEKRERLLLKRAQLPPGEQSVALEAELRSVCDQLARLEAVRQRATSRRSAR